MKNTIKQAVSKLKGERAVKLNRLFHKFFNLGKQEQRATEKHCRDNRIYNYIEISRY